MTTVETLDSLTRRAGAMIVERGGAAVAADYGSPAGELAVCLTSVGIADRSDLAKLVVTGPPAAVAEVVRRVTGDSPAATGVAASAGAWWCASGPDRVLVLTEPGRRLRLLEILRNVIRPLAGARVDDASAELAAIAVVGRATTKVLGDLGLLGAHGDPRKTPPFTRGLVAGAAVEVLLESDRRALLVTDAADAGRVWHGMEAAGRPHRISCVGLQAIERFSLVDRLALPLPR